MSDLPTVRDPRGRFLPGNPGGPGNPFSGRLSKLRAAVLDAVTEQDLRDVLVGLVQKARSGDVPAARVLLDRVLGPAVEPQDGRLDSDAMEAAARWLLVDVPIPDQERIVSILREARVKPAPIDS